MKPFLRTHILNLENWLLTGNFSDLINFALNEESILELISISENKSNQKANRSNFNKTNQKHKNQRNISSRRNQNYNKQNYAKKNYKSSNYDQQYRDKNNNENSSKRCLICNQKN
jgi:hypothetical protein